MKFNVTITRDVTEQASVSIEADSHEAAIKQADAQYRESRILTRSTDWELVSESLRAITAVPDPESAS